MATEKVIYDADTTRVLAALEKVINKEVQLRQGMKQTKTETKDGGNMFAWLGDKAAASLTRMAAGTLTVRQVISLLRQETQDTAKAIAELVRESKGLEAASLAVANQMNIASTVGGQQAAAENLKRVMLAGQLTDPEMGQAVLTAGQSLSHRPGQLLAGEGMTMAERIAAYSGFKGLDAATVGGLAKIMKQAGTTSESEVLRRLSQAQAANEMLLTIDPLANAQGQSSLMQNMSNAVADSMAQGGTYEQGLAEYMQMVSVTGSGKEANKLRDSAGRLLGSDDVMLAAGRMRWSELKHAKDERVRARLDSLGMRERQRLLAEYVATRSAGEWSRMGLDPRQAGWLGQSFGQEGQEAMAARQRALEGMTGENVAAQLAAWGETPAAITRGVAAETAVMPLGTPDTVKRGEALLGQARELNRLQLSGSRENTIRMRTLYDLEQEAYIIAAQEMKKRFEALPVSEMTPEDYVKARRLIYDKLGEAASGGGLRQLNIPLIGGMNPYTTASLGEADIEMRQFEEKYRGKNASSVMVNNGTIINNNHGPNDMATVGQERPGGENTF
jgi:hypothetical protein